MRTILLKLLWHWLLRHLPRAWHLIRVVSQQAGNNWAAEEVEDQGWRRNMIRVVCSHRLCAQRKPCVSACTLSRNAPMHKPLLDIGTAPDTAGDV